ncbi:MAG: hypothetical protein R3C44_15465 [Chloroflexota bacterium]
MNPNQFSSFLRANWNLLNGRYHFPKERIGEHMEVDGQDFTIFRQMFVDAEDTADPEVVFKVRFHVENMSPDINKIFSLFTIPFFSGLPGFRSKLWLLDETTGDNMGIYEWATAEDAEFYSRSFAMHFMTGRSTPGSAQFEIVPGGVGIR